MIQNMRVILQRAASASVDVEGERTGEIRAGLVVLLGVEQTDGEEDIAWLAAKIVGLRIFPGSESEWSRSVLEVGGEILLVSQFTLFASTRKGTKPSWHRAAKPEAARVLYEGMAAKLKSCLGRPVALGRFGAIMQVTMVNDGPVTILLDSRNRE